MNVASLELCRELYELSGWELDEARRPIEKVWMRSYHTSEMGPAHDDYDTTPEEQRREVVVGDWRVTDNWKGRMTTGQEVFKWWYSKVRELELESFPAYSLGYLLRRLPATVWSEEYKRPANLWQRKDSDELRGDYYFAFYFAIGVADVVSEHGESANTPEDALTKLAIELFKQGVLNREVAG